VTAVETIDQDQAQPHDQAYQRRLLGVVMLAVTAFGSLMTIVTVSLGDIAQDLGSDRGTLTWMITGLMLAMAVCTPIAGKVGDIRGHRPIFLIGLAGGVVATLAAALAPNAASMIAFRVLFGVTGALVMPNGMALMMQAFGSRRRAAAMGWYQFAMTGAPTIGLVIGGPLIDVVGWRWIFAAFAGVSVVALAVGARVIRPGPTMPGVPVDYLGGATLGASVLAGLLAMTRVASVLRDGSALAAVTDAAAVALVVVCGLGIAAFVRVERRAPAPMLQLRYFAKRNFTLPMVSSSLVQFAYMGGFVVTPALLGDLYGLGIGMVALLMAPRPGAFSLASPLGGYLATAIGERRPVILGAVTMVASMLAFVAASGMTGSAGLVVIVVGLVLTGVSAGISQPAVAAMVVGSVDPEDMGIANGMNQQIMFIGIVSGIQTMNVFLGDGASAGRFAATFAFGAAVAALGLAAALATRNVSSGTAPRSRRHRGGITSA
jgi:MFS family permease